MVGQVICFSGSGTTHNMLRGVQHVLNIRHMSWCSLCTSRFTEIILCSWWDCESYAPQECRHQRNQSCWGDGRTDGRRDGQHVWFIASITLFISSPLIKRNAVYQSYYIHTNGHTIAVNHSVVNKSLNQDVFFFFFHFVVGLFYCGKKCRRAGHHSFENKTKLSNIYTRII